ncbi:hypothetical protein F4556_003758 [Kitasatospora gansuensis]|uniref:Histidine kinase/HSP90-like ATPase domain-containing protein n=1 Tax=Kitasatospora gansuensis TaxID=258050 RepID=A0A7W7WIH9_9ACTN|nr:hypothetical protein [Kitasatospora gansuensis]
MTALPAPEPLAPAVRGRWRLLPGSPTSSQTARALVSAALAGWEVADLEAAALLVASELVTNAVVHTGCRTIGLSLRLDHRVLRIGVRDSSPAVPVLLPLTDSLTGGRGLAVVAASSVAWGMQPMPFGKLVWAELARPAPPRPPTASPVIHLRPARVRPTGQIRAAS